MNKTLVIGLVGILAIGGIAFFAMKGSINEEAAMVQEESEGNEEMMNEESLEMDETTMADNDMDVMNDSEESGDPMMNDEEKGEGASKESEENMNKEDGMKSAGSYETYSGDKVARAESGDVVLFFHASWCPSCRGLNSDIETNAGQIPDGVSILKVDYDKETELKKKYGVTTQHTLVQVDKDGELIDKWSGSSSLDKVVAKIQ